MAKKDSRFTDVDQSHDPKFFVTCLDQQYAKNKVLLADKQHTLTLMDIQSGHIVLDAGCGTAVDVLQMAEFVGDSGHIYGIDFSHEMIETAQERVGMDKPITLQQSSIYDLPFEDKMFDRCRADKTFQHLDNPKAALAELIRVTKSGGKIVIADPDHDSLIIDTPYTDINRRFARFRSDQMMQGSIAHQLYGMFKDAGLVDVTIEPRTTAYTNYYEKAASPYLDEIWFAQKHGIVTQEEAEQWVAYLQEAIDTGRFLCMQTYTVTTGVKV